MQQTLAQEADSESQEAVENLLESYFMQIDSTYDKLKGIGEYIEDTEEYINIDLDSSRNRLLRLEIILTAGTFAIAIFSVIAGDCSILTLYPSPSATPRDPKQM